MENMFLFCTYLNQKQSYSKVCLFPEAKKVKGYINICPTLPLELNLYMEKHIIYNDR